MSSTLGSSDRLKEADGGVDRHRLVFISIEWSESRLESFDLEWKMHSLPTKAPRCMVPKLETLKN